MFRPNLDPDYQADASLASEEKTDSTKMSVQDKPMTAVQHEQDSDEDMEAERGRMRQT